MKSHANLIRTFYIDLNKTIANTSAMPLYGNRALTMHYIGPSTLTTNLLQAISDNQASLVAARAVKDEQSMTQNIRREQDEAFELSLQQDRQKVRTIVSFG